MKSLTTQLFSSILDKNRLLKVVNIEIEILIDRVKLTRDSGNIDHSSGFRKLFETIKVNLVKAYESTSRRYSLRHRHVEYKVGDTEWN